MDTLFLKSKREVTKAFLFHAVVIMGAKTEKIMPHY